MGHPTVDATHSGSDHHTRSHAVTGTSDHTATADRVLYSDNSGNITELALGAADTFLMSNGATSAPSWQAAVLTAEGPLPAIAAVGEISTANRTMSSNTTAHVGLVYISAPITVTQITFEVNGVATAGVLHHALFSNDGQTRYWNESTATITTGGTKTDTITGTALSAGYYYFMMLSDDVGNLDIQTWTGGDPMNTAAAAGLNETEGTVTVTADTIPATFDPDAGVTFEVNHTACLRLN